MRKTLIGLLSCLMALFLAVCAAAEGTAEAAVPGGQVPDLLDGQTLTFSSGVGAWCTSITFGADGAFTGLYHDSEMGEAGEAYPDGTVYFCAFHGRLSDPVQIGTHMWQLTVTDLAPDEGQETETISDGIRFVLSEPYGMKDAGTVILYLPGTPIDSLPEELLFWTHMQEIDPDASELPFCVLWNEAEESGFIGELPDSSAYGMVGMANPWTEITEEDLTAKTGFTFGIPVGAEDVRYFSLNGGEMVEMQFSLNNCRMTARISPQNAFTDISGLYYSWESRQAFNIGPCPAVLWAAPDGTSSVQLCLWYDAVPGLMYSLSAEGEIPSDFDITATAASVYIPIQTDAVP